ncbi:MAG: sulfotransferase [Rhodospirillales bacterium]
MNVSNGRAEGFKVPIFVLAPPRSFTSIFCGALGVHPELFGVPELNLFQVADMTEFLTGPEKMPAPARVVWRLRGKEGLLRTLAELYAGEQTIRSVEMAERWIRVRRNRAVADVYREVCRKVYPRRIVDKSPAYASRSRFLDHILTVFPDALFIHLVRHPRGQCESVMKTRGFPVWALFQNAIDRSADPPQIDPQILWHDMNVRILNFLERVPEQNWTRVQGETFMSDTDGELERICRWLGISGSEEAMRSMRHPEHSPFACFGPINAAYGNDPNFLRSPYLRPQRLEDQSLDGPVRWRQDGAGFHPRVVALARSFGYD